MAEKIIMPQGGQDISEGRVVKWRKAEGDPVAQGEVICEVETEKAVFEVESPIAGVLLKIIVPAGKVAPVFSAIGVVGRPGEALDLEEAEPEEKPDETAAKEAPGMDMAALKKRAAEKGSDRKSLVKASGRARKLADQRGIDISRVPGSGPGGRITEKDVAAFLEKPEAPPPPVETPRATAAEPCADARGTTVPMTRMRRAIARRLQQSKQTIPHFYVTVAVDMSAAIALRVELNAKAGADGKISLNDMIVKASAMALQDVPQVNCKIEDDAIVYLKDIHIGVAVSVEEGLLVPVLSEVDTLSLKGIAKKTREIADLAKAGKLASLTPGSFTISNMGMMDVDNFIAIINPPETAILAVGSIRRQLKVGGDDAIQIRDMMNMTLSADHRAVDGALGARFINRVKSYLEKPHCLAG